MPDAAAAQGHALPDTAQAGGGPAKVSLREQADEAQRELAMRHRVYPGLVKRGKMTEAEQAVAIARMRAIRDTLRLFAEHEEAMRAALATAIRRKAQAAEIEAVREQPIVEELLGMFPEAEITGVQPIEGEAA